MTEPREISLFDTLVPECGECALLGAAIDSGIRYCHGAMTWRRAWEHVDPCSYRTPKIPVASV